MRQLSRFLRLQLVSFGIVCFVLSLAATGADDPPLDASKPPARKPTHERVSLPLVGADKFGEGWKQTVRFESEPAGDVFEFWVKNGWLHAKRTTPEGALDWQIALARVIGSELPKISYIEGTSVFELSYRDGRYFIREFANFLRCLREHAPAEICTPRAALLEATAKSSGWGGSSRAELMLSAWRTDDWFFVASGPNDQRFGTLVRLNARAKAERGYGVTTTVGGLLRYFHGDTWLLDDGELLVVSRYTSDLSSDEVVERQLKN